MVTNLKQREGVIKNHPDMIGTGEPADTDTLAKDTITYPVGSTYLDTTNFKLYTRFATAGVAADWKAVTFA